LNGILKLEPEHADARKALAELLHDTQQWESLWPHLEQEVKAARADATLPANQRADIYARAARCAVELGKFAVANELYDLACATDPKPALRLERAEALYRAKAFEPAAAGFQALAVQQELERPQQIAVYRRLAQIQSELGKASQALVFHQRVLDLDPAHRDTLQ